jgi:hypothetical protein
VLSSKIASKVTRADASFQNLTLRHSTMNRRFGAVPVTAVRTLAELSTQRSSQYGYAARFDVFAAGGDGMAPWFHAEPFGWVKLTTPLVSTHAVEYEPPYSFTGNGVVICW